jgi:hypothetical protein
MAVGRRLQEVEEIVFQRYTIPHDDAAPISQARARV